MHFRYLFISYIYNVDTRRNTIIDPINRVKAGSLNSKGQTIIFIFSYELLNIYFLFQGLVNKFIVTQICHQVLRLSLRKGRISY